MHDLQILLIDDALEFRMAVTQVLGVYHAVDAVGSLEEARNILEEKQFDAVLLDQTLPDGRGVDLLPEIRRTSPTAAVLVLSGDDDFHSIRKAIRAGADDYIVKTEHVVQDLLIKLLMMDERMTVSARIPRTESELSSSHFDHFIKTAERQYLNRALHLVEGDVTALASRIGFARSTLFKRLSDLGISRREGDNR